MPNPQRGPKGKVFEPQLSPEARARIEREHREAVTRTINEAMANMPLNRECGRALENLNILCQKIDMSATQIDTIKRDFAQMIIDEALNGKMFNQSYKQYYNKMLSDLLSAGAKARNEDLFKVAPAGGANNPIFPRESEITNTFERFMQSFSENMRSNGIRRTNYLPEYGGNDAKGLFDVQIAAQKTLIKDSVQMTYERCSRRGAATVSETCEAARRAVDNAFFYAKAFPNPSDQGVDANAPGMREAGIRESSDVIRGLQEVHSSRSWRWMLRHPFDYIREAATIRSLKGIMRERGGLTQAEVEQKLPQPKKTYDEVKKSYDEIHDRYSEHKLAEAERELAEDRRQRELQREVEGAKNYSKEQILEDGLDIEQVHARGRAEFEADIDALEQLEDQPRDRSYDEPDQNSDLNLSENDKVPIEIAEEQAEEKSEPIADNEKISAPQIDIK